MVNQTQKKPFLTGFLLVLFVTSTLLSVYFDPFNLHEEAYDTSESLQPPDLPRRSTYVTDGEENWLINGTFEDTYKPWNNDTYNDPSHQNNMTTYWTGDPTHQNETGPGELNIILRIDGYPIGSYYYYDRGDKVWWSQTVMVDRHTPIPETEEGARLVFDYYVMAADNETGRIRERIKLRFWINDTLMWEGRLRDLTGPGSGWTYVKITSAEGMKLSEWLNERLPSYLEFKVELVVIDDAYGSEPYSNTTQIYVDNVGLIIESESTYYILSPEVTATYGDHVNFSVYYTYFNISESKLKLVENAQIGIDYNGTPWMGGFGFEKHNDPVLSSYTVTLQAPQTIDSGLYYPVWVNASAPGFERQRFPIKVNVVNISTALNAPYTMLVREHGVAAAFEITFRDAYNDAPITGANVVYGWSYGSEPLNEIGNGVYNFTIDTDYLGVGTYYINVTASKENYDSQFLQLTLEIIPISTTLNADKITLTREIGEKAVFEVTFSDSQCSVLRGANLTYEWDYGSGQLLEEGDGVYTLTIKTSSLDEGTYYINVTASLKDYEIQSLQLSLVIRAAFMDQFLDYLPYLILLAIGAFASVVLARVYSTHRQERLDREKIRRIMVVLKSFALYDQTPFGVIAEEGSVIDKELVSGFFTAIKDITSEVSGITLENMKVYPDHPYYFVYTGTFYCILILSDKPSKRLEEKVLYFAEVVEEKYGNIYSSDTFGVLDIQLDLDEEVIRIFGITPMAVLQDIVTISLSYEEIEEVEVEDDVKKILRTGRSLADQKKEFFLEELIQASKVEFGDDIKKAHEAFIKAMKRGFLILEKSETKEEKKIDNTERRPKNQETNTPIKR
ncbi:MAG: hypothetical protein Q6356_003350 [Candidatus Wukongarchaeota archaeon]|nr:hypothetical protein [Candidatus Wukongarchaeota archaeon]